MFEKWLKNYEKLMLKTRIISQIGAFLLLVLAIVDLFGVGKAISYAENISWEATWVATILPMAFIIGFAIRFRFLFIRERVSVFKSAITWWAGVFAVLIGGIDFHKCWVNCQLDPNITVTYGFYGPFNNALVSAGVLFIALSILRFLITASQAFLQPNEFNPHS